MVFLIVVSGWTCQRAMADDSPTLGKDIIRDRFERLIRRVEDPAAITLSRSQSDLQKSVDDIQADLEDLRTVKVTRAVLDPALVADLEIFIKGAQWALRYDTDGKPTESAARLQVHRTLRKTSEIVGDWENAVGD